MLLQVLRFGVIGGTALCVHWLVVALLVPLTGIAPLTANVAAFAIAFQASYWGHRHWTFEAAHLSHRSTLPRFMLTAGASFALNQFLYFLLLRYADLDYRVSLFIVLILVAAVTFVLSRQWAFR